MVYCKESTNESYMSSSSREKPLFIKHTNSTSFVGKEFEDIGKKIKVMAIKLPKRQPRRSFNPTKMQHLIESIKKYGILEPLIVRPLSYQDYELVAGERRYRAAKEVGLLEVPVIVRDLNDKEAFELALLENLQRDDLNPIDETEGMLELLCQSLDCTREDVISLLNNAANAKRRDQKLTDNVIRQLKTVDSIFLTVGRISRESYRTNRLPLLNLPIDVLNVLRQGKLEYTKAKAIAKLDTKQQRKKLMQQVIDENMSLKKLKERINELQGSDTSKKSNDAAGQLRKRFVSLSQVKSDAWKDKDRQEEIESILAELERILDVTRKK